MRAQTERLARSQALIALLAAAAAATGGLGAAPAAAQPTAGFVEDFAVGTGGFSGGTPHGNPGTGGVDGAADGYLRLATPASQNFGTRSISADYAGDYLAAGITHIRFWLNDVEGDQAFEVHLGIGRNGVENYWQYNVPFSPPENAWAEFEVDLGDSTRFTQIHGAGSFAAALQNATNISIRHDLAPYIGTPNPIAGELGIDKVQLIGTSPVEARTWGRIKELYR